MTEPKSTADYRKYPKGPNFGLIVGLASVFLVLALIAAYLLLSESGRRLLPHRPNPRPNARLVRELPASTEAAA